MVEQLIRNQQVAGSSPASSSKIKGVLWGSFYFGDLPNLAPGEGRPGRDRQKHLTFLSCLILQRSLFRRTCGLREVEVYVVLLTSPASSSKKIRESEMAPVFLWRSAESRPGRRSPWTRSADMIVLSIALDLATIAIPSHLRLAGSRSLRCAPYESGQ